MLLARARKEEAEFIPVAVDEDELDGEGWADDDDDNDRWVLLGG